MNYFEEDPEFFQELPDVFELPSDLPDHHDDLPEFMTHIDDFEPNLDLSEQLPNDSVQLPAPPAPVSGYNNSYNQLRRNYSNVQHGSFIMHRHPTSPHQAPPAPPAQPPFTAPHNDRVTEYEPFVGIDQAHSFISRCNNLNNAYIAIPVHFIGRIRDYGNNRTKVYGYIIHDL